MITDLNSSSIGKENWMTVEERRNDDEKELVSETIEKAEKKMIHITYW